MPSSSIRFNRRRAPSGPTPWPRVETVKRTVLPEKPGPAGPSSAAARERAFASWISRLSVASVQPGSRPLSTLIPLVDEAHGANRTLRPWQRSSNERASRRAICADVLREMLLIRRFEEKVEERFRAGELPGFLHVAIGQEACAVGVCRALGDGDVIASTHRAHGHTLAKGTHPNELMAELYGKQEGCSHGYGGSMHLYDVERGNLGANAVIGGGLPQITGAALAFQMRGEPRVAVAFFGDGATNIGTFHEALNLAQLWKVPAVFVLEDNHWAESTPEIAALADPRPLRAREGVRDEGDEGRRPGRRGRLQDRAQGARARARRRRARSSSTSTRAASAATTSATRRSTATRTRRRSCARRATRSSSCARSSRCPTRSSTSSTPR